MNQRGALLIENYPQVEAPGTRKRPQLGSCPTNDETNRIRGNN